ncbi:MAG: NUDIX hydrolase [Gammaproteobacteria bacterium]|nr:NUDIX hydrolase [Gammaproteobacteria bacterium]
MNFCSSCGARVVQRIPPGDDLARHVCEACETIHYQNPKIVAGCIPEWGNRILMCRRAIEPRQGLWTLPAGFMEMGETTEEAAARETLEESGASVEIGQLYSVFSIPRINQVYIMFRGQMKCESFQAGAESLEVKLVRADQIPWDELAFPVIRIILERYISEREQGTYGIYVGNIDTGRVLRTDAD